jgi:hypothetical protein
MIVFANPRPSRPDFFLSLQQGDLEIEEGFVLPFKGKNFFVVAIQKMMDGQAKIWLTLVSC